MSTQQEAVLSNLITQLRTAGHTEEAGALAALFLSRDEWRAHAKRLLARDGQALDQQSVIALVTEWYAARTEALERAAAMEEEVRYLRGALEELAVLSLERQRTEQDLRLLLTAQQQAQLVSA